MRQDSIYHYNCVQLYTCTWHLVVRATCFVARGTSPTITAITTFTNELLTLTKTLLPISDCHKTACRVLYSQPTKLKYWLQEPTNLHQVCYQHFSKSYTKEHIALTLGSMIFVWDSNYQFLIQSCINFSHTIDKKAMHPPRPSSVLATKYGPIPMLLA